MDGFKKFKAQIKLQLDHKIKTLQTDWDDKYRTFTDFLSSLGIFHRHHCPHTHEQNDTVERKHRYIVKNSLTLLVQSGFPLKFGMRLFKQLFIFVVSYHTTVLSSKSPFEALYYTKP